MEECGYRSNTEHQYEIHYFVTKPISREIRRYAFRRPRKCQPVCHRLSAHTIPL